MQEDHFWIILEAVRFWQFWPPRDILGITKNSCVFWRSLYLENSSMEEGVKYGQMTKIMQK